MQNTDTKRSVKAPETRQRLLDFGLAAFTKKGSLGVNLVEDVLRPSNTSVGSFYHQFSDKTELLCEVLNRAIECRQLAVNEMFEPSNGKELFAETIYAVISVLFDSFDNIQHGWQMQIRESTHEDIAVRRIISRGRKKWTTNIASFVERTNKVSAAESSVRAEQAVIYGTGLAKYYLELSPTTRRKRRSELIESGTQFLAVALSA